MNRGELWIGSGGADYTGKPRPVLILQDDRFDSTASITICPLTTTALSLGLFRIEITPSDENGLHANCSVMLDKVSTVPRTKLDHRVGALSSLQMADVDRALLTFLGLAPPISTSR